MTPVTEADSKQRFADAVVDSRRHRLIAVVEDHSGEGEAVNTVGAVGQSCTARCCGVHNLSVWSVRQMHSKNKLCVAEFAAHNQHECLCLELEAL